MQRAALLARLAQGAIFVVFSANYLLDFLPMPQAPETGAAFMGALFATGYIFPVVKLVEFSSGLLLLSGRGVPLALTLLAPIVINIFLYHLRLDPSGLPLGTLVLLLNIFLAWAYRGSFASVLDLKARPKT